MDNNIDSKTQQMFLSFSNKHHKERLLPFHHPIYIHLKDKNKDEDAENTIPVRSSFKYISRHHRIDFLFFLLKSQKVFYKCIVIQGNVNLAFIQNIPIRLPLLLILLSVCRHTRGSVCTWNVPSLWVHRRGINIKRYGISVIQDIQQTHWIEQKILKIRLVAVHVCSLYGWWWWQRKTNKSQLEEKGEEITFKSKLAFVDRPHLIYLTRKKSVYIYDTSIYGSAFQ